MGLEKYISAGKEYLNNTARAITLISLPFINGVYASAQEDMPRFADPPLRPGVTKLDDQKGASNKIQMSPPPGYESKNRGFSEKYDLKDLETAIFHEEDWARIYLSKDDTSKQKFEKDWMSKSKKERESIVYALSEPLSYVENRFSNKDQDCVEKINSAYHFLERKNMDKYMETSKKDFDGSVGIVPIFKKGVSLEELQEEYNKEYLGLIDLSRQLGRKELILIYEHEKKKDGLKRLNTDLFKSYKLDY
ncbi:MAG: hypothetical protein WC867_08745 [Candidatus Pacearchaeota archaeon]|jgi:hypothetical protein